jgi:hypothetical protein
MRAPEPVTEKDEAASSADGIEGLGDLLLVRLLGAAPFYDSLLRWRIRPSLRMV